MKKRSGYRQSDYRERAENACATHWAFGRREEALAAAAMERDRHGASASVFQCHWCRRWRVGITRAVAG